MRGFGGRNALSLPHHRGEDADGGFELVVQHRHQLDGVGGGGAAFLLQSAIKPGRPEGRGGSGHGGGSHALALLHCPGSTQACSDRKSVVWGKRLSVMFNTGAVSFTKK